MRVINVRNVIDSWRFWSLVSYAVLSGLVVWHVQINKRVHHTALEARAASIANSNAIAYLCQTNAILEALTNQTIFLLQSEQLQPPPSIPRTITISIFRGYAEVLRNAEPCVRAERRALHP